MTKWHIRQRAKDWVRKSFLHPDPKSAVTKKGKIVETSNQYNELEKTHKKWYLPWTMGRQKQMPRFQRPREDRKTGKTWLKHKHKQY